MNMKDVTRKAKSERKNVRINLRTTRSVSKWMNDKSVSPQKVFDLTVKELMKGK